MSVQLIQQYHNRIDRIIRYGGSRNESSVRSAFQNLLEHYARQKNLELIAELSYRTRPGHLITPDGTLKDALRQDWGYWESKDEYDSLDTEIQNKFARGYPQNNILFEDTQTAVLIQAGREVARVSFHDAPALDALLTRFVSYETPEVREFREAIENFSRDVPDLAEELRRLIQEQVAQNATFRKAAQDFLELCQEAINPNMEMADVREMIVQHVLTEDIFITVFNEPQFHRENIIAHELGQVVGTFYKRQVRRQIDGRIATYTRVIKARAAQISDHHEKQKFLKVLYESFYKAYNPKGADRLGIVYTPNEIVGFMIEAANHLCFKHFGKTLGDQGVEILDPATGTGTFITELIEHLPPHQLAYKYQHELHCNEVAILPYYIANLNIEYTYKQKMGQYVPFENIVFVDTLDNMGFRTQYVRQLGLFGLTDENLARIKRQNEREISVIIGNPPYNANQLNENENNKNREYPEIDQRIKDTYIKHSTAQKTKLYDMYARFLRWASDRLGKNGIIAFVSNNSFIDARTYDGFRKVAAEEFNEIYIIDMKGNARTSGERRRREGGNIFSDEIRVGAAVYFLIRDENAEGCRIYYNAVRDYARAGEKKAYLRDNKLSDLTFERIAPSKRYNWINLAENDWDALIPVASKDFKQGKDDAEQAIFRLFSLGVVTNRDEWVYDFNERNVLEKVSFFQRIYENELQRWNQSSKSIPINDFVDRTIKWTSELEQHLLRGTVIDIDSRCIRPSTYRPFVKMPFYFDRIIVHRLYQHEAIFPVKTSLENKVITFSIGNRLPFSTLATKYIPNLNLYSLDPAQCLPFYRYDEAGNRVDNITDWALTQFRTHYDMPQISKEDIFHYVYAVLHHPAYRQKYRLNLKREFPRIPFYHDFPQWAAWGQQLIALHLHYETIPPHPLTRHEKDPATTRQPNRPRLKADKANGTIQLDTLTTLSGIPPAAWQYKLGNRSALEWILDRYKERKPRDPTIATHFNTYRFADYKEQVIDLLMRVTTVSIQTMAIIEEMPSTDNTTT